MNEQPAEYPWLSGLIESWDRVRVVRGGVLHAHGEIEVDLTSGPAPIFEMRFSYGGSSATITRHVSLDSALAQSRLLQHMLDERGWQSPAGTPSGTREAC